MSLVNKVAESGIITLNLEDFFPKEPPVVFDMKDYLFMALILKEKDFREALKTLDVEPYRDKIVALTCSTDAVIPMWAYMLVTSLLQPVAKEIQYGSAEEVTRRIAMRNISNLDPSVYQDQRVVLKGCGEKPIGEDAYVEATRVLRPVVKSIMYGEPCSTVPVYKMKSQK